ncbi:hypothetical protein NDU88_006616 [Pleurodeles waltl]|uniref:Uncharacterized protein n=1 Tax=Pleurodeles waltl TaxID=8319 RepID=A0AAV7PLX8_PLEWA|nr:hypothetical protein NDU88_006616 [Pleurodeles waltl]
MNIVQASDSGDASIPARAATPVCCSVAVLQRARDRDAKGSKMPPGSARVAGIGCEQLYCAMPRELHVQSKINYYGFGVLLSKRAITCALSVWRRNARACVTI